MIKINTTPRSGIIYDLDGTVIDTNGLNEEAWVHALAPYGVIPTKEQFLFQRGRLGEVCSRHMLPVHLHQYAGEVLHEQLKYVEDRYASVSVFRGFWETYEELRVKDKLVSICTSAPRERIALLLEQQPEFIVLQDYVVCRGMYAQGKPFPEPLLVTAGKMRLLPSQLIYVGDAESDYLAAVAAGIDFIYFCPEEDRRDRSIPLALPILSQHHEILSLFNEKLVVSNA